MKKLFYFIFIPFLYYQVVWGMLENQLDAQKLTAALLSAGKALPTGKPNLGNLKRQIRAANLRALSEVAPTPQVSPVPRPIAVHSLKDVQEGFEQISAHGFEWGIDHYDLTHPAVILKDNNDINSSFEQSLNTFEDLGEMRKNKRNKLRDLLDKKSEETSLLSRNVYKCLLSEIIQSKVAELPASAVDLEKIAQHAKNHEIKDLQEVCQKLPAIYQDEIELNTIELFLRKDITLLNELIKNNRQDLNDPLNAIAEDTDELKNIEPKHARANSNSKHKRNQSVFASPAEYTHFSFPPGKEE